MKKEIIVFNHDKCLGTIEVEVAEDDLIQVFTAADAEDNPIYILYVADMDYGIEISKETFCRINEAMNAQEEDED